MISSNFRRAVGDLRLPSGSNPPERLILQVIANSDMDIEAVCDTGRKLAQWLENSGHGDMVKDLKKGIETVERGYEIDIWAWDPVEKTDKEAEKEMEEHNIEVRKANLGELLRQILLLEQSIVVGLGEYDYVQYRSQCGVR